MNLLTNERVLLNQNLASKEELFKEIAKRASNAALITNQEDLIKAFNERENEVSTAFENGFAIPHAHSTSILQPCVYFIRLENPLNWDGQNKVSNIISLLIPDQTDNNNDIHLETLSGIAVKLLDDNIRQRLMESMDVNEIVLLLSEPTNFATSNIEVDNQKTSELKTIKVVGITSCATGVAHTYMARDALIKAANGKGWESHFEAQGQRGQEFALTDQQIADADVVILATDIGVDTSRFNGKKIYRLGTKEAVNKPSETLDKAIENGQIEASGIANPKGDFSIKNKQKPLSHVMNGISYMIPFVVFAGIISAICSGITSAAHIDLSKPFGELNGGEQFLKILTDFGGIGFTVMMAIAGAYIANSIAGRSAIAPAFVLTMAGNNTKLVWQGYFANTFVKNPFLGMAGNENPEAVISLNDLMQPLNIIGAIIFGLAVGYTVKWINTRWKINKYILPIMPIIIIPVFLSAIFWIVWMFTFGPLLGVVFGYFNYAIMQLESNGVGMALTGLVLGLLSGVDMGGPINKIASFGATALIPIDGGVAMACSAAAFGVAPMGCGITALIFKKKMKDDQQIGTSATILGFMGISEGAIPFAIKYTWAAIIPNIIASGFAGMFAGIFGLKSLAAAWGGVIIAVFGSVTTVGGSFIGILWYVAAIAIGVAIHIAIFRLMVGLWLKRQIKRGKTELIDEDTERSSIQKVKIFNFAKPINKLISQREKKLEEKRKDNSSLI